MSVVESAIIKEKGSVRWCIGAGPKAHTAISMASRGERDDEYAYAGLPGIGA